MSFISTMFPDTDKEKHFGVRSFLYKILSSAILGGFLIIVSLAISPLSELLISKTGIRLTFEQIELMHRVINILIAILFLSGVLAVIFGILSAIFRYASLTYTLGDYAFKLEKGLISKNEISIPYKNIQAVDTDQSVMYRIFGLSTLIIVSAGNSQDSKIKTSEKFDLIDDSVADYLKEELLKRASLK